MKCFEHSFEGRERERRSDGVGESCIWDKKIALCGKKRIEIFDGGGEIEDVGHSSMNI